MTASPSRAAIPGLELAEAHPCRLILSAPWGASLPATGEPGLYIVQAGAAFIRTATCPRPVRLEPGDLALLPKGDAHALCHEASARARPAAQFFAEHGGGRGVDMAAGGGGAESRVDTLCFRLRSASARRLMAVLPDLVIMPGRGHDVWTAHVGRALGVLLRSPEVGEGDTAARLTEVLLAAALRQRLSRPALTDGGDPTVLVAVALIHSDLAHPFRTKELARRVGRSKSSFHDRFVQAMGTSPMEYVARVRMQHAAELLSGTDLSVQEVAEAVGYRTASAFAVAFRRHLGCTPREMRGRPSSSGAS